MNFRKVSKVREERVRFLFGFEEKSRFSFLSESRNVLEAGFLRLV